MPSQGLVTNLIANAFLLASAQMKPVHERWIRASFAMGSILPHSLLMVSVQRVGTLDVVLRCMEQEVDLSDQDAWDDVSVIGTNAHFTLSNIWTTELYEAMRVARLILKDNATELFTSLFADLDILRMAIDKHQIAKDTRLKAPIEMWSSQPSEQASEPVIYDRKDPQRSHIMPHGISARGSAVWQATDGRTLTSRWIERLNLSDRFLELYAATSPTVASLKT